jgi:hypothetical protein
MPTNFTSREKDRNRGMAVAAVLAATLRMVMHSGHALGFVLAESSSPSNAWRRRV